MRLQVRACDLPIHKRQELLLIVCSLRAEHACAVSKTRYKGWVGSNRNRQAVAQRVAAAAETAKLGSRPGTLLRVLAVGGGLAVKAEAAA